MSKEEVFLRDIKKPSRNWKIDFNLDLEDQRWIYYSTIGSFVLLIILNFIFPEVSVTKVPFDSGKGFISIFMIFFGTIFLLNFLINARSGNLQTILLSLSGLVLSLALLYFGLPILIGFSW